MDDVAYLFVFRVCVFFQDRQSEKNRHAYDFVHTYRMLFVFSLSFIFYFLENAYE